MIWAPSHRPVLVGAQRSYWAILPGKRVGEKKNVGRTFLPYLPQKKEKNKNMPTYNRCRGLILAGKGMPSETSRDLILHLKLGYQRAENSRVTLCSQHTVEVGVKPSLMPMEFE